jgi:pimeloyl-ACP methyl ester carboxylesterase
VSLRGRLADGPILVWLSGGPGASEFGPRRSYLRALEDDWLVVDWEQRGSGMSYAGEDGWRELSIERMVQDTLELVALLHAGFPDRSLVLVGHSFGTVIGTLAAARAGDAIDAYVGTAQAVDWARQESDGYAWALAEARRRGVAKAVTQLEGLGEPTAGCYASGVSGLGKQRNWVRVFGGVAARPSFALSMMLGMFFSPSYPFRAKVGLARGMGPVMAKLWPQLGAEVDFLRDVTVLDTRLFLFMGQDDRITPIDQVREWVEVVQAPVKRLDEVPGAAHLAVFEQPERFVGFLREVAASLREATAAPKGD